MKFLRDTLDKLRPNFQKGGKLSFLHSTFDAMETFLFVPGHTTTGKVHIRDGVDLKRTMITVVVAMIPVLLFGIWNTGYQHYLSMGQASTMMDNVLFGLMKV